MSSSFDVGALPGRASDLWNAGLNNLHMNRGTVMMHIPSQAEVLGVYDDWLAIPDPAYFATATNGLHTAMSKLTSGGFASDSTGHDRSIPANGNLFEVSTAGDTFDDWTGTAALTFKQSYGDKFLAMANSQFQALYLLREAINAEAALWQEVRHTLDDLSNDAIHQVDQSGHCSSSDFKLGLEVLGAVVAVAAAVPTGGASVAGAAAAEAAFDGWAVVGAGVAVASTGMDAVAAGGHTTDTQGLANGTPMEIFDSLKSALSDLKDGLRSRETKITKHMQDVLDNIDGKWNQYCLPPPALAGATMKNVTNDSEMGHPR